jgi:hypothetical protein
MGRCDHVAMVPQRMSVFARVTSDNTSMRHPIGCVVAHLAGKSEKVPGSAHRGAAGPQL